MNAGDRRQQLCTAARELFVTNGYRGTTTSAVAEAGGVSEALLIKHFGSKEAMFREAIAEPLVSLLNGAVEANHARVHARVREGEGVGEQIGRLREFGTGWAGMIRDFGPLLLAVLREASDFPDVVSQVGAMLTSLVDQVADSLRLLTAGEDYAEFDVHVATYAGLAGFAAAAIAGSEAEQIERFVDEFVGIMMFGLLSATGRRRSARLRVAGA